MNRTTNNITDNANDNITLSAAKSTKSAPSSASKDPKPVPARKEDCVFEATAANFQQVRARTLTYLRSDSMALRQAHCGHSEK